MTNHSLKTKKADFSDATRFYAEQVGKGVDFFHFPGHASKYCFKETNTWDLKVKMGFNQLNTPAFNWLIMFKNVVGMNEGRFSHFFLFMIDLHNLKIEGQLKNVNPNLSFRQTHCESAQNSMRKYESYSLDETNPTLVSFKPPSTIDDLDKTMQNLKIREQDEFI